MTLVRTTRSGGCPLCGASGAVCGHPSDSVPVDSRMEVAVVGGPLKKYTVTMPGGVETVMKLNAGDAERLGGVPLEEPQPAGEESAAAEPAAKKRTPRNKARSVADKSVKEEGGGG